VTQSSKLEYSLKKPSGADILGLLQQYLFAALLVRIQRSRLYRSRRIVLSALLGSHVAPISKQSMSIHQSLGLRLESRTEISSAGSNTSN
jgi:hypothetical protein